MDGRLHTATLGRDVPAAGVLLVPRWAWNTGSAALLIGFALAFLPWDQPSFCGSVVLVLGLVVMTLCAACEFMLNQVHWKPMREQEHGRLIELAGRNTGRKQVRITMFSELDAGGRITKIGVRKAVRKRLPR